MEFLTQLWVPILVSAALVFVVSSIIHMCTPLHKGECRKVKNEDALRAALRAQGLAPGSYGLPAPTSMKDMGSPEMLAKYNEGPVAFLTVMPSAPPAMGRSLLQWFVMCLAVGVFAAYLTWVALGAGASYLSVFRFSGTVAFAAYGFSPICDSIWKGQSWRTAFVYVFDGVLYALATAGAFGAFWPA